MKKLNLNVKKFYICLTILGFSGQATAAGVPLEGPKTSSLKATTLQQKKSATTLKGPKSPTLILDNKDLFQKLERLTMGPRTGGGGNSCSLAISQNTRKLIDLFQLETFSAIVDFDKVLPIIKQTRFYIQDSLIKDGETKDAMNFPAEVAIYFTPKFCATELVEVSGRSMSLLLHEYLGLAQIEDRKYEISGKFLELYAENVAKNAQVRIYLEKELAKDLRGEKSCFGGAIKRKSAEVSEENPDGFEESDLGRIETQIVKSAEYRNSLQNCDEFLDKNGQKTSDMQKALFKVCKTHEPYEHVATIPFPQFQRRVNVQDGLIFKVEESRAITLTVDKDEDYASLETAKKSSVRSSYKCTPLTF